MSECVCLSLRLLVSAAVSLRLRVSMHGAAAYTPHTDSHTCDVLTNTLAQRSFDYCMFASGLRLELDPGACCAAW